MKTAIEQIAEQYGYKPKQVEYFFQWIFNQPGQTSLRIRKAIVRSFLNVTDGLVEDEVNFDAEHINDMHELEYAAQLLQELAEAKIS